MGKERDNIVEGLIQKRTQLVDEAVQNSAAKEYKNYLYSTKEYKELENIAKITKSSPHLNVFFKGKDYNAGVSIGLSSIRGIVQCTQNGIEINFQSRETIKTSKQLRAYISDLIELNKAVERIEKLDFSNVAGPGEDF